MSTKSEFYRLSLAVAGLFLCGVASAAADEDSSAPAYRVGGVTIYPGMGIALMSDSNILRLPDADPNKISSKVTVLSPSLSLKARNDANVYSLAYIADIGRYSNSQEDNYVDQRFNGLAELGLTTRSTLTIKPEYEIGHDSRGSTFGTPTADPNTWHSTSLDGSFSYGAEEARGHVVLDLGYNDRQYQNNRAVTISYDKTLTSAGGTLYFRMQPKTSLLAHARQTNISYEQVGSLLNGKEDRYMVGAKWEATAQTTGEVKIGKVKKTFDSTLPSYSGGSWEGDVRWSPVAYVRVDMSSSKYTSESTLVGSSTILISDSGANIAYDVNDRVTLHVKGYRMKEDFVQANRADYTDTYGLKAEYKFRTWLIADADFTSRTKTSNIPFNDYKRNIFMLSLRTVI